MISNRCASAGERERGRERILEDLVPDCAKHLARMRSRFVLFGDSLTQRGFELEHRGWAAALANAYTRKVRVSEV